MSRRGYKKEVIGPIALYPTNSFSPIMRLLGVLKIAYSIKGAEVVSAQDPFETGLVAWVIAWAKGIPLHIQVHTDFLSPAYARLSIRNRIRVHIARYVISEASRVRVVSERIKESIERQLKPKVPVTVLPIFTDVERFKHTPLDRDLVQRYAAFTKKVLVVSRLEPEKNVALAIRSFAMAAPKDACLIILGSGSLRAALDRTVRELKISHRVFWEYQLDVAPYYKIADVVLSTSHYEGYGLVIMEALSAGKPVISTDVGIAKEAGAVIANRDNYADVLRDWFKNGQRTGNLQFHPYRDFDEYARAYCQDIASCVSH